MSDDLARAILNGLREPLALESGAIPTASQIRAAAAAVRSYLLSEKRVEAAARGLAKHDRHTICSDATYRLSGYGPKAIAALTAAMGGEDGR